MSKSYKLYAFPYSLEAVDEAVKHRFNRINIRYVLVYEEPDKLITDTSLYHIINEDETGYLSDSEKAWLLECNIQIITDESLKKEIEQFCMKNSYQFYISEHVDLGFSDK